MEYDIEKYRLPTDYQSFIANSRYSRWLEEEGRREIWPEPVVRYVENVVRPALKGKVDDVELDVICKDVFENIASCNVMPSMRMLMTAGEALNRDHMAGYNCSFVAIDHPRAFDEILYILTCGTGVGFSCETKYINKLPEVAEELHETDTTIVVGDSRIGWASSFRELLSLLYAGKLPKFDVSKVRPKGARLKTFGGRASGPEPLVDLFNHCIRTFRGAAGRRLNSVEVHSIVCKIGEIVVVGGVRRSALISLSDLHDNKMRHAKSFYQVVWHTVSPERSGNVCYIDASGDEQTKWVFGLGDYDIALLQKKKIGWWHVYPEFALANNSAVYEEKPSVGVFLEEWKALYDSKSGERGIYNRDGIRKKTKKIGKRDPDLVVGTNPCGEIALRSCGLCNLSEVVVRSNDNAESLEKKVKIATLLGTIQSTYTNFRYVRPVWKRNAEEERLLGVSLTGIFDWSGDWSEPLVGLSIIANQENEKWANILGISPSLAITTVKPSGTVSQLTDSASGIHPRHSPYYIRSVRGDNKDPMTQFLKDSGIPNEPCVMKGDTTTVFFFPMKAPEGAITRDDISALDHLKVWKLFNDNWSEHQVSVTVSVKEEEWVSVAAWVHENFDSITGISFLPYDNGSYRQAPYQTCTKEEYEAFLNKMPSSIDWNKLKEYEKEDATTGARELACVAGVCEIL
jgi:ribonucleoside-triphosphate reductase (thioredoxin)